MATAWVQRATGTVTDTFEAMTMLAEIVVAALELLGLNEGNRLGVLRQTLMHLGVRKVNAT